MLNQSYKNFELIVVGDGCTDDTAEKMAAINDPRVRFYNLSERGQYPSNPRHRRMVAGTPPINRAIYEARGAWIAHLDDDEIFTPTHIEDLLNYALLHNAEVVYSKHRREVRPGVWSEWGKEPLIEYCSVYGAHTTFMWRNYLKLFRFDMNALKAGVGVDVHRWMRMQMAGVRFGFVDKVTAIAPLRPGATTFTHLAEGSNLGKAS